MEVKLKYRSYVGEKYPDIASKLIDSDIEKFAIEFSEHLLEQLRQYNVSGQSDGNDAKLPVSRWVAVEDELPNNLETVWISNGKGWTTLGCLVEHIDGWHWAVTNGVIYQDNGLIVSECESDDLDVRFWHELPKPPCV